MGIGGSSPRAQPSRFLGGFGRLTTRLVGPLGVHGGTGHSFRSNSRSCLGISTLAEAFAGIQSRSGAGRLPPTPTRNTAYRESHGPRSTRSTSLMPEVRPLHEEEHHVSRHPPDGLCRRGALARPGHAVAHQQHLRGGGPSGRFLYGRRALPLRAPHGGAHPGPQGPLPGRHGRVPGHRPQGLRGGPVRGRGPHAGRSGRWRGRHLPQGGHAGSQWRARVAAGRAARAAARPGRQEPHPPLRAGLHRPRWRHRHHPEERGDPRGPARTPSASPSTSRTGPSGTSRTSTTRSSSWRRPAGRSGS